MSPYTATAYSAMANEAAHEAWLKLSETERQELQTIIDTIQANQKERNSNQYRHVNAVASGGIELLAKLGMYLNGVRYAEYIQDSQKGKTK